MRRAGKVLSVLLLALMLAVAVTACGEPDLEGHPLDIIEYEALPVDDSFDAEKIIIGYTLWGTTDEMRRNQTSLEFDEAKIGDVLVSDFGGELSVADIFEGGIQIKSTFGGTVVSGDSEPTDIITVFSGEKKVINGQTDAGGQLLLYIIYGDYEEEEPVAEEGAEVTEGFTEQELADMQYVTDAIIELVESEDFKGYTMSERAASADALLYQLAEDGYITDVYFDGEELFSFKYKCGVLGGLSLRLGDEYYYEDESGEKIYFN